MNIYSTSPDLTSISDDDVCQSWKKVWQALSSLHRPVHQHKGEGCLLRQGLISRCLCWSLPCCMAKQLCSVWSWLLSAVHGLPFWRCHKGEHTVGLTSGRVNDARTDEDIQLTSKAKWHNAWCPCHSDNIISIISGVLWAPNHCWSRTLENWQKLGMRSKAQRGTTWM